MGNYKIGYKGSIRAQLLAVVTIACLVGLLTIVPETNCQIQENHSIPKDMWVCK